MNEFSIASKTGLLSSNISNLLNGTADFGTASKIGVLTTSLQGFLNGRANIEMAKKVGMLTTDMQFMLDRVGRQGAIGIVLGILLQKNQRHIPTW